MYVMVENFLPQPERRLQTLECVRVLRLLVEHYGYESESSVLSFFNLNYLSLYIAFGWV